MLPSSAQVSRTPYQHINYKTSMSLLKSTAKMLIKTSSMFWFFFFLIYYWLKYYNKLPTFLSKMRVDCSCKRISPIEALKCPIKRVLENSFKRLKVWCVWRHKFEEKQRSLLFFSTTLGPSGSHISPLTVQALNGQWHWKALEE